jgi:hypothetical protein
MKNTRSASKQEIIARNNKSKGGFARSEALSPQERKDIARKAASARWDGDLPIATHEGDFGLGDAVVSSAVLPNGKRIITQATFLRALGRSRSPKAGTGIFSTADGVPFFLQAEILQPFITDALMQATTPIFYRTLSGGKGVGYDAQLLPKVADVYLKFRDQCLVERGEIPKQYRHITKAADLLVRGLANVGIIALIDEATGYQRDRAKDALERILQAFIAKELRPWVHTFPDDFYQHLFRLRGLQYPRDSVKRPQYFGHLTNNIVYARLAPKVLEELKKIVPRNLQGRHRFHLHRRLTEDIGHPKLREHLASVVTLMRISEGYQQFENYLDKAHPKYNENLLLPFTVEDDANGQGI